MTDKKLAHNASPARQPDGSHGGGQSVAGGQKLKYKNSKFKIWHLQYRIKYHI